MRRAKAIVLIAVLVALPLTLLAGGGSPNGMCDGYCCLPRGHHVAQMQMSNHSMGEEKPAEGMSCHRGRLGHFSDCTMKSNSREVDYTILAPLPPTNLSASSALVFPVVSRRATIVISQAPNSGFLSIPFEPPRL